MKKADVILYTDGGCSGNPGPGGWAYILKHPKSGKKLEAFGSEKETTNNRMEMMAVIEGLKALKAPTTVEVVTDSKYVGQGMTEWMPNWKKKNWRGAGNKPIKNLDLWQILDELLQQHKIHFTHVKGHSGHIENERCDELAVNAYQKYLS